MEEMDFEKLKGSVVTIASELFRFQRVFEKAVSKLDVDEQNKYMSQYAWFAKRVMKAMENANLKLVNVEGQFYDPGMAITPLNLEDFDVDDRLYVSQMMEPIIMEGDTVIKTGTAILGRIEK